MTAARKLVADEDQLFSFDDAPPGEPFTEEERAAFEAGMEDIRAGRCRTIDREEMRAKLERMRREQRG
jgi:hypothetical protein